MNLVKDASVNESGLLMVYVPSTVHAASEGFVFRLPAQIVTSIPEGTRVEITTMEGNGSMPFSVELDLTGTDALAGRPAAWPAAWGLKASA